MSYDPKVDALARAAGQEDALLPVERATTESLKVMVERVMDSAASRRQVLHAFAEMQSALALRPAKIASELFG